MDEFEGKNKETFRDILNHATKVSLSPNFTQSIMNQIVNIDMKKMGYANLMRRSYLYFIFAVFFSVIGVFQLNYFDIAFSGIGNIAIAEIFHVFIYVMLTMLAGLIFYQLNNLFYYRFTENK